MVLVEGPRFGVLTLNPDGSYQYVPHADYHGEDRFTYRLNDGELNSGIATVTLTVKPVNDDPEAKDDAFTVSEDQLLIGSVLANDRDVDSALLTVTLVDAALHGVVELHPDGSFRYATATDFHGTDHFTYRLSDGAAVSRIATVELTITPVNDAPTAASLAAELAEDGTLVIDLPALVTDVDGDSLAFAVG